MREIITKSFCRKSLANEDFSCALFVSLYIRAPNDVANPAITGYNRGFAQSVQMLKRLLPISEKQGVARPVLAFSPKTSEEGNHEYL